MAGFGERPALQGQEDGATRRVERGAVHVVAGHAVLEAAGIPQGLEAEAIGERPEMPGEAQRAYPAGIVREERGGEAGEEPGIERGVVGDHDVGPEGAYRGGQGGEGLGQAGLALHVLRREVMHGGGGGWDVPPGIDQAGMEGLAGVEVAGGRVDDADAGGGDLDDAMLAGIEAGGFDVDGDGADGRHGVFLSGWRPGGTGRSGVCVRGTFLAGGGGNFCRPSSTFF